VNVDAPQDIAPIVTVLLFVFVMPDIVWVSVAAEKLFALASADQLALIFGALNTNIIYAFDTAVPSIPTTGLADQVPLNTAHETHICGIVPES